MAKPVLDDKVSTKRTYILLLKSLFDLLTEKPFEKITLTELCDRAMIPRSTFYRYFEDKHDLLRFGIYAFFHDASFNGDTVYVQDVYSIRSFMLAIIKLLGHDRGRYYRLYQVNKNGDFMDILKQYLSDILDMKIRESEEQGVCLKISQPVLIYLLTDFYFSAVKGFLELTEPESVDSYVDDVCLFFEKDFFK